MNQLLTADVRKPFTMPGFTAEASIYVPDVPYCLKRFAQRRAIDSSRRAIAIIDYDPRWPALFDVERQRILSNVGPRAVSIEHIGSSSVPGLGGRAEIDVLLGTKSTKDIEECARLLRGLGYREAARPPSASDGWRLLEKASPIPIGLLIVLHGSDLWRRHIWFRDYLRRQPAIAESYRRLKSQWATRYGSDITAYQAAKNRFVSSLEERTRGS